MKMDQFFTAETFDTLLPQLGLWGTNIAAALIILISGWILGRWLRKRIRNSKVGGAHLDATLKPILASAIFYVIFAMTLYATLIKLGVPPSSLIAVFGAAGLAIGLALKDTLANIAAGMVLLFLRPLEVGDFVDIGSTAGTIIEVGLFSTTLKNVDGLFIYVPNANVWNTRIQNFSRHQIRRCVIPVGVSYDTDLKQAQAVLLETVGLATERIADDITPAPPEVFVTGFDDSAINFECRVWLPAENWFARTSELRIAIIAALGKANIEIPFPQRVVTMKEGGK